MTNGTVSSDLTPNFGITLVGTNHTEKQIEAFVDTGFNGALSTSAQTAQELGWLFRGSEEVILADGSKTQMTVYRGIVMWKGIPRIVNALMSDAKPSIGMSLLDGSELRIQVKRGGEVFIGDLP
jgi:clan AA aspartic protease